MLPSASWSVIEGQTDGQTHSVHIPDPADAVSGVSVAEGESSNDPGARFDAAESSGMSVLDDIDGATSTGWGNPASVAPVPVQRGSDGTDAGLASGDGLLSTGVPAGSASGSVHRATLADDPISLDVKFRETAWSSVSGSAPLSHPIDLHIATTALDGWPMLALSAWTRDVTGRNTISEHELENEPESPSQPTDLYATLASLSPSMTPIHSIHPIHLIHLIHLIYRFTGGYGILRLPMRSGTSKRCAALWRPRGTALEDWNGERDTMVTWVPPGARTKGGRQDQDLDRVRVGIEIGFDDCSSLSSRTWPHYAVLSLPYPSLPRRVPARSPARAHGRKHVPRPRAEPRPRRLEGVVGWIGQCPCVGD